MARKVFLARGSRISDAISPPTVDATRARLGGRVSPEAGPFRIGAIVDVATAGGGARAGVVLAAELAAIDVLFERGHVKRSDPSAVTLRTGPAPEALRVAAARAAIFGGLREGQAVEVDRGEGVIARGVLREKCRYGALVSLAGGVVLGVGFQRVSPAPGIADAKS